MIKAIFLDMDDTLIVNQALYDRAEAQLYGYLQHFGVKPAEAKRVFEEKNKEFFKIYGRSSKRPPATFEAVLKDLVPGADDEMINIVREQGASAFKARAHLKPGIAEAIEILAQHYPIYIITAGDKDIQKTRLSHLPFLDKISGVMIVPQKNADTYKAAVKKWNLNPDETVMVGDSVNSDIVPALAAGLDAVWIDAHTSSHLEAPKSFPNQKGAHKFDSLLDLAQTLEKTGELQSAPTTSARKPALMKTVSL